MRALVEWPADDTASFADIIDPLNDLAHRIIDVTDREISDPIGYVGYEIGGLAHSLGVLESMTVEYLEWARDEWGMDRLHVLLTLAVQLGIEQGRRVEAKESKVRRLIDLAGVSDEIL